MKNVLGFIAFAFAFSTATKAQDAAKTETVQVAEVLQSSRPIEAPAAEVTPQNGTKQEPVKKEDKKDAPSSQPAPAPSSGSKTESKPGSTEKMAITEQGVNKNKKKKTAAAATTTTPPPAPPEEKK